MLRKLGQFFLLASILLLALFYASDVAGQTNFNLFFGWLAVSALAFLLLRRGRKDEQGPRRFRTLRKLGRRGHPSEEADESE
jgi:hypothetical protein